MAVNVQVFLFAALYIASSIEAAPAPVEPDCKCNDLSIAETDTLMEYLKEIDPKQGDYPILPGEIAPAVPCNCIEYNRRKRKTQPDSTEVASETPEEIAPEKEAGSEDTGDDEDWLAELPEDYGMLPGEDDKTCPSHHIRYGGYCVPIPGMF